MLKILTKNEIEKVYNEMMIYDFPDNELKPLWMIQDISHELCYGYFEEDQLKGYCMILLKENQCILDYLGVEKKSRNQGIGSKILKELRELLLDVDIIIESEKPYDEISKKRLQFYLRNDWILNQVIVLFYGVDYYIFSSRPLNIEQIESIYTHLYPASRLKDHLNIKECIIEL